jgi:selenide,water dikinase
LTTAQKQGLIESSELQVAIDSMCTLNSIGSVVAKIPGVLAVTDVTGFGLLGHLSEVCEGSGVSARIDFNQVPTLPGVYKYLELECTPGGTRRNYFSVQEQVSELTDRQRDLLCDPQTSGGLLCVVRQEAIPHFLEATSDAGLELQAIGQTLEPMDKLVTVV